MEQSIDTLQSLFIGAGIGYILGNAIWAVFNNYWSKREKSK